MKIQFDLKPKYAIIGIILLLSLVLYQLNRPLKYDFSSVYDSTENHHSVQIKTGTDSKRYNERCADDVAENLNKAKITNYDIKTVNDGKYQLYYINGEKIN